jgi:hypothetical protein
MFYGNPTIPLIDYGPGNEQFGTAPSTGIRFDVGGEGFVAQTSASAPAGQYSRRQHEEVMAALAAEENARKEAAAAAEKARTAGIYAEARARRAARIAAAEAKLAAARYGNQELSIIAAAKRLAGLST